MKVKFSNYNFSLPKNLIAQKPALPRDHARLLVYNRKTGSIIDDYFYNIDEYLDPKTTLVLNDSKVEKARLKFGKLEVFITRAINNHTIEALVFPGKKFKKDQDIVLASGLIVHVDDVLPDGQRVLTFSLALDNPLMIKHKHTPFPPYIKPNEKLSHQYQTVYAKNLGSKAAPTAGLHFTSGLLDNLKLKHQIAQITLHVGLGTFAPLKSENLKSGKLHQEYFEIDKQNAKTLNQAKHITAIGTTSVRTLESANKEGKFVAGNGWTEIFIRPGYEFRAVDSVITNFHLPQSSLLMLVAAFTGAEEMKQIYNHAIKQKYRFYSFGDCMLIT